MKLLLDENLPRQLKQEFEDHEIYTVGEMGWSGKENGELLALIIVNKFDAMLTGDKNLQHQQNFDTYSIPVIVINALFITYPSIKPMIPRILEALNSNLSPGTTLVQEK